MIRIRRLSCPAILQEKAETWTKKYLEQRLHNPRKRPPDSQYAHQDIKDALAAMSQGKCFYCETRLSEDESTVDHYVEVSEEPARAFDWENLFLSCDGCQNKLPEKTVPRADCINPCDPGTEPAEHLGFEDELLVTRAGSHLGRQTIRKYKLNRDGLALKRVRQLQRFSKALRRVYERMVADGRQHLTRQEIEMLQHFQDPESPYSLMFRCLLFQDEEVRRLLSGAPLGA